MNLVVVGLLVGLWAWVLLPGLLRERRAKESRTSEPTAERSADPSLPTGSARQSGDRSGRQVLVLGDPERIVSARTRSRAEVRRRTMLARGGFAVAVAVGGGVLIGGWWWTPAAIAGVTYLSYVALVMRLERRLAERREMLHDLAEERKRRLPSAGTHRDSRPVELVVGDESGIIITGWQEHESRTH
jgi:heme exporter protein D